MLVQNLRLQGSWVPDQFEGLFEPTQNNLAPPLLWANSRSSGYYWLQLALLPSWIHTLRSVDWQMLAELPFRGWISFRRQLTAQFERLHAVWPPLKWLSRSDNVVRNTGWRCSLPPYERRCFGVFFYLFARHFLTFLTLIIATSTCDLFIRVILWQLVFALLQFRHLIPRRW